MESRHSNENIQKPFKARYVVTMLARMERSDDRREKINQKYFGGSVGYKTDPRRKWSVTSTSHYTKSSSSTAISPRC